MRRRARFRAVALLAVVALSAVPAFAGGRQAVRSTEARGAFASLWQALSELLPILEGRQSIDPDGVLTKGRGTIDPDGTPTSATSTGDESEGRGTIDPNG
jgi:hypothetical protein